ncbi:MAG: hypothetical protein A3H98_02875 [Bacteroidetes bacterium RIFCSPLOWO2_02_FULL_36_8]|nr:MAG: hypothetical protein A3H98_02875 [Bacteroidetes bacterium RIFCSPLOWO2_02_FULL_36_8]OFY72221.1 MAG: hypothetical protein A3G23_01485 [Bacteroidetes bacterium RIFCSPLOWO2_12_FULL_37_12]
MKLTDSPILIFFVLTLFFFIPSQIYLANATEFNYSYTSLLVFIVPFAFLLLALLTAVLIFIRKFPQVYKKALGFLFYFGFMSWLQANIISWDYGLFDGHQILWEKYIKNGLIDGFIWFGIGIILYYFFNKLYEYLRVFSLYLLVIQFSYTGWLYFNLPSELKFQNFEVDETNKYTFSKDENVLIIMLDAFQTDIFNEIIQENPALKSPLDGFTYFRNSLSGHGHTNLSVPNFLTGKYYHNDMSITDFIKNAYLSETSIPKRLKDNGFNVELFPWEIVKKTIYFDSAVMDNLKENKISYNDFTFIFNISIFQFMPHVLKMYFFFNYDWIYEQKENTPINDSQITIGDKNGTAKINSLKFINEFNQLAKGESSKKTLRYYHLAGIHEPLLMDENFNIATSWIPFNRANAKKQAKATLKIIGHFINKLKLINCYDNSFIFILSDHGFPEFGIRDTSFTSNKFISESRTDTAGALALLLVKRKNDKGLLTINDSPTMISDINQTIFDELNLEPKDINRSFFKIKKDAKRKRYFYYTVSGDIDKNYMTTISKLSVEGFSWFPHSWKNTGEKYYPINNKYFKGKVINYRDNELLYFGNEKNYLQYAVSGWSWGEWDYTYTESQKVELKIPNDLSKTNKIIKVRLMPPQENPEIIQEVVLKIDDKTLAKWTVEKEDFYFGIIPEKYIKNPLTLEFNINLPTQNYAKEITPRVGFKTLTLISPFKYGSRINFGKNESNERESDIYIINGFSFPEKNFTWSNNYKSNLVFNIDINKNQDMRVVAKIFPYLAGGKLKEQKVMYYLNGVKSGEWSVNKSGFYEIKFNNSKLKNNMLIITFEYPDAISPLEVTGSGDPRILAIAFENITII